MTVRGADDESIAEASALIRAGRLVAFPTETVYGLGANALDAAAVRRIFSAKGRPATNPLIVHVRSAESAVEIAGVHDVAELLMAAFWPGPLTLVLHKRDVVPAIVTAGGSTVAVRQPRHPVAQALLDAAGVPIAAPSANRSESISPTRAEHVAASLVDTVDLILDGGPCTVGLESTVLDVTVDPPRILRPGMITADQIAAVLAGPVDIDSSTAGIARSPGQMLRHYAPRTPLRIVDDVWTAARATRHTLAVISRVADSPDGFREDIVFPARVKSIGWLPADPGGYAQGLYEALHTADAAGVDEILVEAVPDTEPWRAIWDRLTRAAASTR